MRTRRIIAAVVLAGGLVLTPAVAFAYGATDYTSSVTSSTSAAGTSYDVFVKGPAAAKVLLTITGSNGFTKSLSGALSADAASASKAAYTLGGSAAVLATNAVYISKATVTAQPAVAPVEGSYTFHFTLVDPGTYEFVVTDAVSGAVISTQSVTISSQVLAEGTTNGKAFDSGTSTTGTSATNQVLAATGANAIPLAAGGVLLIGAGAGAVVLARRRRSA